MLSLYKHIRSSKVNVILMMSSTWKENKSNILKNLKLKLEFHMSFY